MPDEKRIPPAPPSTELRKDANTVLAAVNTVAAVVNTSVVAYQAHQSRKPAPPPPQPKED
jgi:hypothetical protein